MGIDDLNPFLNQKMMSRTREIPLNKFSGQIIAIDGHNWGYVNFMVANKKVVQHTRVDVEDVNREDVVQGWINSAVNTVYLFLSHGITPLFIFDGEYLVEKTKTQKKRKQDKTKGWEEINKLKKELQEQSPLSRDPQQITRLKQLLSTTTYIKKEEFNRLSEFLLNIGIPVLRARSDAEELCSSLARHGFVSGVFSEDTDNLVYGCPLMITSMGETYYHPEKKRYCRKAICVVLYDILSELNWDQQTFVDFCITIGCDFNERMYKIGPSRAYNLIQQYGCIDDYPDNYDVTCLNHIRCREIFQAQEPYHVIDNDEIGATQDDLQVNRDLFFKQGEDILRDNNLDDYFPRLWKAYTYLPYPAKGVIPKLPKRRKVTLHHKN